MCCKGITYKFDNFINVPKQFSSEGNKMQSNIVYSYTIIV